MHTRRRRDFAFVLVPAAGLVLSALVFAPGCGSEASLANADGGSSGSSGGGLTDGPGGGGAIDGNTYNPGNGAPGSCQPLVLPDGTSPQCADCKDNDGDGKIDWLDPECVGPLDNDEATFGTGIAGDNMDACKQDCFFDGNSGAGDDGCNWNLKCDPANTSSACPYDPSYHNCPGPQSQHCVDYCQKLTPNGCDCFGCCAVQTPTGTKNVFLSSTCSLATIDDPSKCSPCTQQPSCVNDCGTCELCFGKTTLPPECNTGSTPDSGSTGGTSGQTCSSGAAICNATTPCPAGTYCVTGCCVPVVN